MLSEELIMKVGAEPFYCTRFVQLFLIECPDKIYDY